MATSTLSESELCAQLIKKRGEPYYFVPMNSEVGKFFLRADAPTGLRLENVGVFDTDLIKLHATVVDYCVAVLLGRVQENTFTPEYFAFVEQLKKVGSLAA